MIHKKIQQCFSSSIPFNPANFPYPHRNSSNTKRGVLGRNPKNRSSTECVEFHTLGKLNGQSTAGNNNLIPPAAGSFHHPADCDVYDVWNIQNLSTGHFQSSLFLSHCFSFCSLFGNNVCFNDPFGMCVSQGGQVPVLCFIITFISSFFFCFFVVHNHQA